MCMCDIIAYQKGDGCFLHVPALWQSHVNEYVSRGVVVCASRAAMSASCSRKSKTSRASLKCASLVDLVLRALLDHELVRQQRNSK